MNCFEHPPKPAAAICTYCGRALCRDCVTIVNGKSSCRGDCEKEVERAVRLIQMSEKAMNDRSAVLETSGNVYQKSFVTMTVFGILFVVLGALALLTEFWVGGVILLVLGIVFAISAKSYARAGKRFKRLASDDQNLG